MQYNPSKPRPYKRRGKVQKGRYEIDMRGVLDNGLVIVRERRTFPPNDNAAPIGSRQAAAMAYEEFERWNRYGQVLRPGEIPVLARTAGMTIGTAPTVAQFAKDYLEFCASPNAGRRGANSFATLENKRHGLRHHLLPAFGSLRMDQIHRRDVDHYVATKSKSGRGLRTIRGDIWILRHMLSVAMRHDLIDKIPDFGLPPVEASKVVALTADEAKLLRETLSERCSLRNRTLLELYLRVGLRCGEGLALRPCDFDLESERPTVYVSRSYSRGRMGKTKNGKPRLVPLPLSLARLVEQLIGERGLPKNSPELLFESPVIPGIPLSREHVRDTVERIGKRIGVHLYPHKLRHTYGTECARRGTPPMAIKDWMGHSELKVTMGYLHMVAPDHLRWAHLVDE